MPCGRSICWIGITTLPLSLLQVESICQSFVEVQGVNSDPQDRPILFDKTVIDALIKRCRSLGFLSSGRVTTDPEEPQNECNVGLAIRPEFENRPLSGSMSALAWSHHSRKDFRSSCFRSNAAVRIVKSPMKPRASGAAVQAWRRARHACALSEENVDSYRGECGKEGIAVNGPNEGNGDLSSKFEWELVEPATVGG